MNSIFQVSAGGSVRFVRAVSRAHARVRAFKVWGMQAPSVDPIGHQTPDIGAQGYRMASRALEETAQGVTLRAMQKGRSEALRGFYAPSEAQKTRIANQAQALLRSLGLAQ